MIYIIKRNIWKRIYYHQVSDSVSVVIVTTVVAVIIITSVIINTNTPPPPFTTTNTTTGDLQHLISDAATMQIIRWTSGGFGMAAHNYDGKYVVWCGVV